MKEKKKQTIGRNDPEMLIENLKQSETKAKIDRESSRRTQKLQSTEIYCDKSKCLTMIERKRISDNSKEIFL